jgi:hypothetical protein
MLRRISRRQFARAYTASLEARESRLKRAGLKPGESYESGGSGGEAPPQPTNYAVLRAPKAVVSATGVFTIPNRVGTAALTAPMALVVSSGSSTVAMVTGTAAITAPAARVDSAGTVIAATITGTAHARAPMAAVVSSGFSVIVEIIGSISVSAPMARVDSSGTATPALITGTAQPRAPMAGVSASGLQSTVTLTELPSRRIYQRNPTSATVPLSGTYTGSPGAIEARVVDATTGDQVVAWTTVASSLTGGTWSGSLSIPQGGWHRIQLRPQISSTGIRSATGSFGVGDIWMLAGQSQQALMTTATASAPTPDDKTVYFDGAFWSPPGDASGAATTGVADFSSDFSFEFGPSTTGNGGIRFMNLMRSNTGVPQAVIQAALTGTAISDWEETDPAYLAAVSKLTAAGRIAGLLWHQGGTGITYISRTSYKTRLTNLRTAFEGVAPIGRFGVLPLIHRIEPTDPDYDTQETRRAHYEYIAENPSTINLGWDPALPLSDNVHPTAGGLEKIAYNYAHALLYNMGVVATNNLGPTITGVTRSGATLTLTVQHKSGTSLKINSGTQATGFQVYLRGATQDDATALAISSVALGTDTITITLASDPGSAVDVYYQYGRFDNTSPIYDNTTALGRTDGNALQPLMSPVQSVVETVNLKATGFAGTDVAAGKVTFADSASFDMPDAAWTLGFMTRVSDNSGTAGNYVFSTGNYQAAQSLNFLFWEASSSNPNSVACAFAGSDGTTYNVISTATASGATSALFDGTWRLWIVERTKPNSSATTFNIYQIPVKGTRSLVHTQTANSLTTILPPGGASGVPTLAARALSPGSRYLAGDMHLAFQMDGLLTQAEMENLAAGVDLMTGLSKTPKWYVKLQGTATSISDLSGNGNTGTLSGTVTEVAGPTF